MRFVETGSISIFQLASTNSIHEDCNNAFSQIVQICLSQARRSAFIQRVDKFKLEEAVSSGSNQQVMK